MNLLPNLEFLTSLVCWFALSVRIIIETKQ